MTVSWRINASRAKHLVNYGEAPSSGDCRLAKLAYASPAEPAHEVDGRIPPGQNFHRVSGLKNGTAYCFSVGAYSGPHRAAWSLERVAATPGPPGGGRAPGTARIVVGQPGVTLGPGPGVWPICDTGRADDTVSWTVSNRDSVPAWVRVWAPWNGDGSGHAPTGGGRLPAGLIPPDLRGGPTGGDNPDPDLRSSFTPAGAQVMFLRPGESRRVTYGPLSPNGDYSNGVGGLVHTQVAGNGTADHPNHHHRVLAAVRPHRQAVRRGVGAVPLRRPVVGRSRRSGRAAVRTPHGRPAA